MKGSSHYLRKGGGGSSSRSSEESSSDDSIVVLMGQFGSDPYSSLSEDFSGDHTRQTTIQDGGKLTQRNVLCISSLQMSSLYLSLIFSLVFSVLSLGVAARALGLDVSFCTLAYFSLYVMSPIRLAL